MQKSLFAGCVGAPSDSLTDADAEGADAEALLIEETQSFDGVLVAPNAAALDPVTGEASPALQEGIDHARHAFTVPAGLRSIIVSVHREDANWDLDFRVFGPDGTEVDALAGVGVDKPESADHRSERGDALPSVSSRSSSATSWTRTSRTPRRHHGRRVHVTRLTAALPRGGGAAPGARGRRSRRADARAA